MDVLYRVLDYHWADAAWIDCLRTTGILLGAIIFMWTMVRIHRLGSRQVILRHVMYMIWGILVMAQEVDQLGRPAVLWRLPLLLAGSIIVILIMNDYQHISEEEIGHES